MSYDSGFELDTNARFCGQTLRSLATEAGGSLLEHDVDGDPLGRKPVEALTQPVGRDLVLFHESPRPS